MPPRRLLGIRWPSLPPARWPARSLSDSTASRTDDQVNPLVSIPVATCATPGSGGSLRSPARLPRPSPRSSSASRWAGPWPSVTSTTRHPPVSHWRTSASTREVSPR